MSTPKKPRCNSCNGSGIDRHRPMIWTPEGFMQQLLECMGCGGKGYVEPETDIINDKRGKDNDKRVQFR